ncbi:MAG: valine--tRNA ligase [Oscillospiraceae bacterium]|nr:valine--tRNA ligase [Oscillospiraceae bacterium]
MRELEKHYNHTEVEDKIYTEWLEKNYFHAEIDKNKKPFAIVIPPPNVTGQLHMGHALNHAIQDAIIRVKRMQGYSTLWLPGVDHAGIATQARVEKNLKKERGLSRHDIGREEFLKLVWDWKNKYGSIITNQLKKLGSSCDWSRERFTMDENLSRAVKKAFINYYKKGLVYRGLRIINWCPLCETAISDAEVDYQEQNGNLWHIKYYFKDSDEFITIATTRPETMLGDTAVAVNPNDERYKKYIGRTLILPLLNREIKVIADDYVEMDFGSGCVKVTPYHDPNDFDIGERHNLTKINIFDKTAKINEHGGKYQGLDRFEARKKIVEDLKELGLLEKTENYIHNVGHCDRCKTVIEPWASLQWFVKMKPLAEPAIKAVVGGDIKFVTERFENSYLNWMENIRDWCISRQQWWGHRIPIFYCQDCGEMTVLENEDTETVEVCPKCGSKNLKQDEDVLDTWFSSALWPFSTLGWPDKTEDLAYFYPTNILVTAYDIIPLWVARMIFSGLEFMDEKPFEHIYINGIVRDELGRKISKSLDNGADTLKVIKKYGADVLRFGLLNGIAPGSDTRYSDEKMDAARNFTNKIWNAARFILMNIDIETADIEGLELELEDKWIISLLNKLIAEATNNIENFDVSLAQSKIYEFIWDIFCDWYIELVKTRLNDKTLASNKTAQNVIVYVFVNLLKLLHPYMPFITEEIWKNMPKIKADLDVESIMISKFPKYDERYIFDRDEENLTKIITAIRAIRNKRAELNVPPSKKINLHISGKDKDVFCEKSNDFFRRLAGAADIEYTDIFDSENAVQIITADAIIYIPQSDLIDKEKEIKRLEKELANVENEIARVQSQLNNEGFINKAPTDVIAEKREAEKKYLALRETVVESLAKLKG